MNGIINPERMLWGANLVSQFVGKGVFRSVQAYTVTIANGSATNTATLSPIVVAANCILIPTGSTYSNATDPDSSRFLGYVTLTNGSTVTGTRITNSQGLTLSGIALEFQPGVLKSVQYGTIAITNTLLTNTATITAVNTARAWPICLGVDTNDVNGYAANFAANLTLTSATVVTLTRLGSVGNVTASFCVPEFYL